MTHIIGSLSSSAGQTAAGNGPRPRHPRIHSAFLQCWDGSNPMSLKASKGSTLQSS